MEENNNDLEVEVPFEMTLENVYAGLLAISVIMSHMVPEFDELFAKITASLTVAIREGELGTKEESN